MQSCSIIEQTVSPFLEGNCHSVCNNMTSSRRQVMKNQLFPQTPEVALLPLRSIKPFTVAFSDSSPWWLVQLLEKEAVC